MGQQKKVFEVLKTLCTLGNTVSYRLPSRDASSAGGERWNMRLDLDSVQFKVNAGRYPEVCTTTGDWGNRPQVNAR